MNSMEPFKKNQERDFTSKQSSLQQGLVHYYYGDGKGKTTTLLGLIIRALGHGLKPILIQFLKLHDETDNGKGYFMGEVNFLEGIVPIKQFGSGNFVKSKKGTNYSDKKIAKQGIEFMQNIILEGNYDIVALDEVINLIALNFLEVEDLLGLLEDKPEHVEVICTGAMYYKKIKDYADYVTQFNCLTHPYYEGIDARKGIEF